MPDPARVARRVPGAAGVPGAAAPDPAAGAGGGAEPAAEVGLQVPEDPHRVLPGVGQADRRVSGEKSSEK